MKKTRRKHRGFERYVSAVSDLLESELDELMSVPEDVQENYELLREIKEMLEELFMHVPISSARQKDSCSVGNDPASLHILEQPPQLSSDEQLALEFDQGCVGGRPRAAEPCCIKLHRASNIALSPSCARISPLRIRIRRYPGVNTQTFKAPGQPKRLEF